MKFPILIIFIITLFSCKQNKDVSTPKIENAVEKTSLKEALFIKMERTPCMGNCPIYSISIFNTGNVIYSGRNFVEKKGKYRTQLTSEQLKSLKSKIEEIDLFNLQDQYGKEIVDLPSCVLLVYLNGKKKKISDKYKAPKKLKEFEKLIDTMVITDSLIKLEK